MLPKAKRLQRRGTGDLLHASMDALLHEHVPAPTSLSWDPPLLLTMPISPHSAFTYSDFLGLIYLCFNTAPR